MMAGRRDRRALVGSAAAALALATLTSACGAGDEPGRPPTVSDPVDPGEIPEDHGLSSGVLGSVAASTVGIEGVACGRLAQATGFALTSDLVVTNAHVIVGIDEIRVHTFAGSELIGVPVAFDADADLALLSIPDAGLDPLPLTDDAAVAPGTIGAVVGWGDGPLPDPTPFRIDRRVTVRIERVADTERVERRSWLLAAEIDRGDSGAPLVDSAGAVVGIAFATSTASDGVGYAVRTSEIEELLAGGLDPNLTIPDC